MRIVLRFSGKGYEIRPYGRDVPRYVVPADELEEIVRLWGWDGPARDPDYPQTPEEYADTEGRYPIEIDDPGFF